MPSISTRPARHRSIRPITTPSKGKAVSSRMPIRIGLSTAPAAAAPMRTPIVSTPTGTEVNR
jgi:hypothetical protein